MARAFVLGNGKSREGIDLTKLKEHGPVYACNGIYREFTPDCLVATDWPIAKAIMDSGYANKHRFHTRRAIDGSGARPLIKQYKGFSSGPNAVSLALSDGHEEIYLLGFDFGTQQGQQFNNVYADTQFYKNSSDPPTFAGNWIRQIRELCQAYPNRVFYRVMGESTVFVKDLNALENYKTMTVEQFTSSLNIEY